MKFLDILGLTDTRPKLTIEIRSSGSKSPKFKLSNFKLLFFGNVVSHMI